MNRIIKVISNIIISPIIFITKWVYLILDTIAHFSAYVIHDNLLEFRDKEV